MTLADLVDEYLGMHHGEPVTIAKLRWLLGKATAMLGQVRLADLSPKDVLRLAADDPGGAPVRRDPGAAASPEPRGGVGWLNDNPAKRVPTRPGARRRSGSSIRGSKSRPSPRSWGRCTGRW
jgi:hypothetical protein